MKVSTRCILAFFLGIPSGIVYYIYLLEHNPLSNLVKVFIAIYLVTILSGLIYVLLFKVILPGISRYSTRSKVLWIVGSIFAGAWLAFAIPIPIPAAPPTTHTLEVIATGQKNPLSQGSEVWVTGLFLPNGQKVEVNSFSLGPGWILRNGIPVSYQNQPAKLSWQGVVTGNLRLTLVAHPWSGYAKIIMDGNTQEVDLYNNSDISKEITFQLTSPVPWYYYFLTYYAFGFIFMLALSSLLIFINKKARKKNQSLDNSPNKPRVSSRWKWLIYAFPIFAVYNIYLLIYWPGLMSPDSIDQWNQLSTGVFNDWHPAFHTMLEWLLTRFWNSPASIVIFQILVMGMVVGWGLAEFEKMGTPPWANWLTIGVFLILPDFPVMTVTLWKDVLYSISVLLLSVMALKIIFSKGMWLNRKYAWIVVGCAAVLVALFRHNGSPVAFGFLILAIIFYPAYWKKWLGALVLGIGLWLIITGPFYKSFGVTKVKEEDIIPAISLFGIEAHVAIDTSILNTPKYSYLAQILPAKEWSNYSCSWATAITLNPYLSQKFYLLYEERLLSTYIQMTRDYPKTTLDHVLCATSYIWRVTQTPDYYYGTMAYDESSVAWAKDFLMKYGYDPKYFVNALHKTALPMLRDFVNNKYRPVISEFTHTILSRPAIYLYLMLLAIGLYAFRTSSLSILLLAIPALLQSGVMAAVAMTPELRYQYSVMLVGALVFLPLLTIPARQSIENPSKKEQ